MNKITINHLRGAVSGGIPSKLRAEIYKNLSYRKPGAEFTPSFRNKQWDGRVRFFTLGSQTFPAGFADDVIHLFKKHSVGYELDDQREAVPNISEDIIKDACTLGDIQLRDYQRDAVIAGLEKCRGIIKIPTGGGKTEVAIAIIKALNLPTLFVVPGIELMHQTADRFKNRLPDWDIGMIGDKEKSSGFVTVASAKSLVSYSKGSKRATVKKATILRELEETVKVMVLDECHTIGSATFNKIATYTKIPYKFGFSATPLDRTDGNTMNLIGAMGSIIYDLSISKLIEEGVLAKPIVHIERITAPDYKEKKVKYPEVYKKCIVENEERNERIMDIAVKEAPNPTLILVTRINHGRNLAAMINAQGVSCMFLHGSLAGDERQEAIRDFEEGKYTVIVGTTIFNTGVDLPSVNAVVLAGGGQSKLALLQKIGRGMRLNDSGDEFRVYDFADFTHKYLIDHSLSRIREYKREKAFELIDHKEDE